MTKDWVETLPVDAKNALIKDVCFAGTHDSAGYSSMNSDVILDGEPSFVGIVRGISPVTINLFHNQVNKFTMTQNTTIYKQLMNGIRYFDLRFAYSTKHNRFYTLHTFAMAPLDEVLNDIRRFSISNPNEMIILDIGLYFTLEGKSEIGVKGLNYVLEHLKGLVYTRKTGDSQNVIGTKSINDVVGSGSPIIIIENSYSQNPSIQQKSINDVWIDTSNIEEKFDGLVLQVENFQPNTGNSYKLEWTLTPQVIQIITSFKSLELMSEVFYTKLDDFLFEIGETGRNKIGIICVDFEGNTDIGYVCKTINVDKYT